jgi:hypothetical protein
MGSPHITCQITCIRSGHHSEEVPTVICLFGLLAGNCMFLSSEHNQISTIVIMLPFASTKCYKLCKLLLHSSHKYVIIF